MSVSKVLLAVVAMATAAPAQVWVQLPIEGPSPRRNAAAIYDPQAHRIVFFGGRGSSGDLNDVWALDLTRESWSEITPDDDGPTPRPRYTHNIVYDPASHRALIWSGRNLSSQGSTLLNDVWGFDLASDRWQSIEPATEPPVARYGTAAVFDETDGSLVTFAGFTTQGRFDDTYRFDAATSAWRDVSPSEGPRQRCLHAAALDARRQRMIIFGGQSGGASLDDAWAFDLAADTWTQLASAPETGGRKFPAAAYDPVNDELLVFGGESTDGTRGGDLWALSLESDTWQQRTDEGPSARDGAVLVHVPGEDRFVLFGGTGEDGNLGDTWIYALPPRPTAVVSSSTVTPAAPGLEAWPNPFNAGVVLDVAGSQPSQLRIYDSLGRQVRDLGAVPAGGRRLSWDGTDAQGREAASGLYLVVARYAGATQAKRVVLVR